MTHLPKRKAIPLVKGNISFDVIVPQSASIAGNVTIGTGTLLTDNVIIGSDAIIERGVIFAERGKHPTRLASGVRIGAGTIIGPDVEIGWGAHILPGSVVHSSVPANAIVSGNPAQIVGYTRGFSGETEEEPGDTLAPRHREQSRTELNVGGAALFQMPKVSDLRGSLSVGELGGDFPFQPRRYFIVFDVPSEELRGEHAHRECQQFLICAHGSCRALLDDGTTRDEVVLDRPDLGLYMPAMIWGTQYRYTRDAVLLVFASLPYDSADYIRTYDEFRNEMASGKP